MNLHKVTHVQSEFAAYTNMMGGVGATGHVTQPVPLTGLVE